MRIPKYIQKVIEEQQMHIVSTATKEGIPNTIYVGFLKIYNDSQILIANNKFCKTEQNLLENPNICFLVFDNENRKAYQVKGKASIYTEGQVFDDTVSWVHSRREDMDPKSGVLVDVLEVYSGKEKIEEE